ncbi:MAG: ATP synthase F0 subunit B [Terriglobia bacterium]
MRVSLRRALTRGLFAACLLGLAGSLGFTRTFTLDHSLASARAPEGEEAGNKAGHELLYKFINLALLVGTLGFVLRKPLAGFFAERSASIRKGLEEGRKALEVSQAQLKIVEEKLQHLEEEIAAFRASAEREMEAERQRLKLAAAEEAEKILQSARAQTEVAVRAAKLELKSYAAEQAVELAEGIIRRRLDEAGRKQLVSDFLTEVESRKSRVEGAVESRESRVESTDERRN